METFTEADVKTLRRLTSILNGGELTKEEFVKSFEEVVKIVLDIEQKIVNGNAADKAASQAEFDSLKAKSKDDFASYKKDATTFVGKLVADFKLSIQDRLDGIDTELASFSDDRAQDKEDLRTELAAMIPTIEEIETKLPVLGKEIRNALELLQGDDRLDISAIRGVEKLQLEILAAQKSGKPVSFVGGARGIYVYIGGIKKGIMNTLNFVAGTGMTIAYSKVNGFDTLTFNSSGGGVTVETPVEIPNAVITVFTVSARPKWIVADGTTYYEGAGYSYASLQVTLDVPPSSFIRAIV